MSTAMTIKTTATARVESEDDLREDASAVPPVHPNIINRLVEQLDLGSGVALDEQRSDVIAMSRLLGIVFVHHETLVLTQHGRKLARASYSERRMFWEKSLFRIPAFREIVSFLKSSPSKMAARSVIFRRVSCIFRDEANHELFDTLLNWGVFSGILSFDSQSQCVGLQ